MLFRSTNSAMIEDVCSNLIDRTTQVMNEHNKEWRDAEPMRSIARPRVGIMFWTLNDVVKDDAWNILEYTKLNEVSVRISKTSTMLRNFFDRYCVVIVGDSSTWEMTSPENSPKFDEWIKSAITVFRENEIPVFTMSHLLHR